MGDISVRFRLIYLHEKYKEAVLCLVTGVGDARARVGDAYYHFWHILPGDYPGDLQPHLDFINIELTKRQSSAHITNKIGFNLSHMKNKSASKIADRIFFIYDELSQRI